ncbi:MAG: DNA-methyltransferase [Planctomycetota bacterium]|jgi:site-specific DNA-methyltransferase (adenine-specific)
MQKFLNKIICGDCIEVLKGCKSFADLIFADPPFNIGYKYDKYNDKQKHDNYVAWTKEWMGVCKEVLRPHGSFYIAIGDEYAADVKKIADELKLVMRNWLIWHYTFGQQMKNKFARSHTHILYFVRDKNHFTFNADVTRVISDRQKRYYDKRANPEGKMPDDVWDEYPRVCGTFDERTDFPCQMPESLLARVIRASSCEGDWVVDPFSGSGTTAVVAHKLKRLYTGIEVSEKYVKESEKRIKDSEGLPVEGEGLPKWPEHADRELKWLYHENKVPDGQLRGNKMLLALFTTKLNHRLKRLQHYTPDDVIDQLEELRKTGKLGALRGERVRSE